LKKVDKMEVMRKYLMWENKLKKKYTGTVCYPNCIYLKGQSHEKFCEIGVWGLSLGQN
jgi:hypothetical protein